MEDPKSPTDWLPPGWTVEVRVRRNGKKDKCYTDPSKELKFFSKPEVLRYLSNLETKHSESKGKRKGNSEIYASPAEAEGLDLAGSGTKPHIIEKKWSRLDTSKDEETRGASAGWEGASVSSFNLPKAADWEPGEKNNSIIGSFGLASVAEAPSEKSKENGVENPRSKRQLGAKELHNKKKPDLPRRVSKRLAGIDVGPIPELKTKNRARSLSGRRVDKAENSTDRNLRALSGLDKFAEKTEEGEKANLKQECPSLLPTENISIPEVETDNKAAEEPGSPLSVTLKDLWMDPCIEFAIKTLTGAIPIGEENHADENPGSSLESPFGDSWGDPCIEFAVKTLTGAIPVVDDLGVQDYLQQQFTSSSTKGDKGSNNSNVGSHELYQTDVLLQHFDAVEKPLCNQQVSLPYNENGGLKNSGNLGLHSHSEEREESLRETICQ